MRSLLEGTMLSLAICCLVWFPALIYSQTFWLAYRSLGIWSLPTLLALPFVFQAIVITRILWKEKKATNSS